MATETTQEVSSKDSKRKITARTFGWLAQYVVGSLSLIIALVLFSQEIPTISPVLYTPAALVLIPYTRNKALAQVDTRMNGWAASIVYLVFWMTGAIIAPPM